MLNTFGFKCFGISITTAGGANTFEPKCILYKLWNCAQGKERCGLSDIGFLEINEFCWQRSGELVVLEGFFFFLFLGRSCVRLQTRSSATTMSAFFDDLLLSSNLKTPLQRLLVTRYTSTTKAKPKRKTRLKGLENEPQTAASSASL